jgi:putative DNA primase/helicase
MWWSLTPDKSIALTVEQLTHTEYQVNIVRRNTETLGLDGAELLMPDKQRSPFWNGGSTLARTLKNIQDFVPGFTIAQLVTVGNEVLAAIKAGNIAPQYTRPLDSNDIGDEISDKYVTDTIENNHIFFCDRANDPENLPLYVWNGGEWGSGAEGVIINDLARIFNDVENRMELRKDKTILMIKGNAMNRVVEPQPLNLISFKNGVLNIATMELKQHDPKHFCVNLIPHDYDPNAKCPNWLKFIGQVTLLGDRKFIQELCGYTMYRATPAAVLVFLTGIGRNGKTVFEKVWNTVLGGKNVTNATPHDIVKDPFTRNQLHHKLANISDDLGSRSISNIGPLLALSGGSLYTLQAKFGHPYDTRFYAKPIYSANEIPNIKSDVLALKDRIKVVKFPHIFRQDPDRSKGERQARDEAELLAELTAETPGIINWALAGLQRLIGNKFKFTMPVSTDEMWEIYKREARPWAAWDEDRIDHSDSDSCQLPEKCYQDFLEWAKAKGLQRQVKRKTFYEGLKDEGWEIEQHRGFGRDGDERKRVYLGVDFKAADKLKVARDCFKTLGPHYTGRIPDGPDYKGGTLSRHYNVPSRDKNNVYVHRAIHIENGGNEDRINRVTECQSITVSQPPAQPAQATGAQAQPESQAGT